MCKVTSRNATLSRFDTASHRSESKRDGWFLANLTVERGGQASQFSALSLRAVGDENDVSRTSADSSPE
jgi:hypothetical protein